MKHSAKFNIGKRFLSVLLLILMILDCFPVAVLAEGEGDTNPEEVTICEVKIRYVTPIYSEGESEVTYVDIYSSYHATLPYGTEYSEESPQIDNYVLVDPDQAVISRTATEESTEILVIYKESIETAKYTVNYWKQDPDGSNLEKLEEYCYEGEGNVGTSVTVKLPSVPGYSWSNDDLLIYITADGNAVKNVYYVKSEKRKLVFRTGTGYAKFIEAYPGEDITAERAAIRNVDPEKPGYKFVNWDKSIAGLGEQVLYNEDHTINTTYNCHEVIDGVDHYYMPANDYVINAIWTEDATPYHVVFWFEKADGSGYANGGIDTTRYALTDTEVTAAYYDRLIVDEKTLFNANFTAIKDITTDDVGNDYNFVENYSEPAKDEKGNVLKDANGNEVVISYTNTYDNPKGKTYAEYKTMPFFGFDFDHCNDVTVTADGNATLNVYYKRETWMIKVYKKPSGTANNEAWRTIKGNYGSVVPAVKEEEADDMQKLPTQTTAEEYYNENKPSGTTDDFQNLRTQSTEKGILFNLKAQQVFTSEDENKNGSHIYSVYPYYHTGNNAKSKRVFYGADLNVLPASSQDLSEDYVNFATSSSSSFGGTIQPAFIFDESRQRKYTWQGAKFRYRFCAKGTKEENITEDWSVWNDVDTKTKPSNNTDITDKLSVGEATVFLRSDGIAYWYFYNEYIEYVPQYDFYLQVILPRKELNLNYVSHNKVVKTEQVECGAPLADYYTYTPADTATQRFVGWYEDAELTQPVDTSAVMGYADNNLYAKWESKECTVSFDPRNGQPSTDVIYNYGDTVVKPADPVKEGFRFVGWYTEEGSHYSFDEELGGDLALHAVWEPIEMVEYTVRHILKRADNTEVLISEITNWDSKHKTVTVSALTNEQKPITFGNLYVVHNGTDSSSQSLDLSLEGDHIATFYYKEMTEWNYTLTYRDIDDPTKKLQDNLTKTTDLTTITIKAPTITTTEDGVEKVWVPVTAIGKRLPNSLKSVKLIVGEENLIALYYDELHTLSFKMNDGSDANAYPERSLIKTETTKVPEAPHYDGHIFLYWNTAEDGTGDTYYPGDTLKMPDSNLTLYAQWVSADATITQGRLLDRISGSAKSTSIAYDGSATALFSLTEDNTENTDIKRIIPNNLRLLSADTFPSKTVITLIIYPEGSSIPQYYYYKVTADTSSVKLTDFFEMGSTTKKYSNTNKLRDFYCQVCINYSENTARSDKIYLSAYEQIESATELTVNLDHSMIKPSGALTATDTTKTVGTLNATINVDAENFGADQSDCRHTNGTLPPYEPVVVITLKDKDDKLVPFPENSIVAVNGTQLKGTGIVAGVLTKAVETGNCTITASGLPDEELTACITLCVADNDTSSATLHPMRYKLGESILIPLDYNEVEKYAVRAQLNGGDINRVFTSPQEDKVLTFDVNYQAENSTATPSVTAFVKQSSSSYMQINSFATNVTVTQEGKATATVTVPANTAVGTYRLKFAIGTAEYNYNLIITED